MITADPAAVKQVFTGDPKLLHAGEGNIVLAPLLGSGSVLLLDGAEHLRHRRLMLPPFHGERMRTYGEVMRDVAERHVATWPRGRPFAGCPDAGDHPRGDHARRLRRRRPASAASCRRAAEAAAELVGSRARCSLLPLTARRRGRAARGAASRALARGRRADLRRDPGAARGADGAERDDILSLLLAARDEDGEPLTDAELRDELMTLLVAGHETTATALAWALERLVRHPTCSPACARSRARAATSTSTP